MKRNISFFLLLAIFHCTVAAQNTHVSPWTKRYGFRPVLSMGPYLQVASPTGITVRWRTDEPDASYVRYGVEAGKLDQVAGDKSRSRDHIVTLTGLRPQTKYYYLIEGGSDTLQGDRNNYFTTLPVAGKQDKYRIGVFGDCGNNSNNQRNTRDHFEKYLGNNPLTAWILLGDNAYSFGKDLEYQNNFFNVYKDDLLKRSPLFPVPGNHDYHDERYSADEAQRSKEVAYYQVFSMPTQGESGGVPSNTQAFYSYDIGNIHFLALDSHGEEDNASRLFDTLGRQVRWIKKDLEANKNKEWIIAYWHHPPYTMGSHNSDNESQLRKIRENFLPILERYGVDLVLCGHSHAYERSGLMQGHYGYEQTFDAQKNSLSTSSGRYDGSKNSCPYVKDATNKGTVYVVSGSSGALDGKQKAFPHNAMVFSDISIGGACMLEIEENRLDLKWICADGVIRDQFTMMKNVNKKTVVNARKGQPVTLTASYVGQYNWTNMHQASRSIEVKPPVGTSTYTVKDPYSCLQEIFEVHVQK